MNILIVGLGNFGKKYIYLLNEFYKSYNIYILRHSRENSINEDSFCRNFNIKKILYSLDDTKTIKLDVVIITNPSTFHVEFANYFIKNNISCLIEKPLSDKYEKSLKLINNNNCCIQIGYLLRYSSLYKILENYENYIGKLLLVKVNVGQYLPDWRENNYRESVSGNKDKGGGVLLELSHDINYLLGFLDIDSYNIKSSFGKISNLDIDVEDYCFIIMDIVMKSKEKSVVNINLDMIDKNSNRSCKLVGENGSILVDFISKNIHIYNNNLNTINNFSNENLLKLQLDDFFNKVKNKNYNNNKSINDSQLTMKIIDDIKSLK